MKLQDKFDYCGPSELFYSHGLRGTRPVTTQEHCPEKELLSSLTWQAHWYHCTREWRVEEYSAEIDRKHHQKVDTSWKIGSVCLKIDNEEIRTYTRGTFTISGTILRITRDFHLGILTSVEFEQLPFHYPTAEADARTRSIPLRDLYTQRSSRVLNWDTAILNTAAQAILSHMQSRSLPWNKLQRLKSKPNTVTVHGKSANCLTRRL